MARGTEARREQRAEHLCRAGKSQTAGAGKANVGQQVDDAAVEAGEELQSMSGPLRTGRGWDPSSLPAAGEDKAWPGLRPASLFDVNWLRGN